MAFASGFEQLQPPLNNAEFRLRPGRVAGITKLHFDSQAELLWVGDETGHVTSYYGTAFDKYTACQAHEQRISSILVVDNHVVTTAGRDVRTGTRQGLLQSTHTLKGIEEAECCINARHESGAVYIGGHGADNNIVVLDVEKSTEIHAYPVDLGSRIIQLKNSSRYLCCASQDGKVGLVDTRSKRLQQTWEAHSNALSDMDVGANMLVTCGYSFSSRAQQMMVEPFIKVYDLRYTKASQPVHYTPGACLMRFVPSPHFSSDQVIVVNQLQQFQAMGIGSGMTTGYPVTIDTGGAACTSLEISSTGKVMAMGDAAGLIHVFGNGDELSNNHNSFETQFAEDDQDIAPISLDNIDDSVSFVPMHYCADGLLSDWETHKDKVLHRPAPIIPPQVRENIKQNDFVGHAPNSVGWKASQVPYPKDFVEVRTPTRLKGGQQVTPGFVRERKKRTSHADKSTPSPMKRAPDLKGLSDIVPKHYRRVDIKYSYLGVDDFNFAHYNKTNFCGLEIHIPNAYCNAMLQVLYFIGPIRSAALGHSCESEFCLVCELGFLFHMLDQVPGTNCQASNLLRSFRTIPEATKLGLILNDNDPEASTEAGLQGLIQSWHRFMIAQMDYRTRTTNAAAASPGRSRRGRGGGAAKDEGAKKGKCPPVSRYLPNHLLWSSTVVQTRTCLTCQQNVSQEKTTLVFELRTPAAELEGEELAKYTFADLLKESICHQERIKAHCDEEKCKDFKTSHVSRTLENLPSVLALNCNVEKNNNSEFWAKRAAIAAKKPEEGEPAPKRSTWIPHQLHLQLNGDDLQVTESHDTFQEAPLKVEDESGTLYELLAVVSHIKDAKSNGNLVAEIKVSEMYYKLKEKISYTSWYLFNDFAIKNITAKDAVSYDMNWKTPCIMYYVKVDLNEGAIIEPKAEQPLEVFQRRMQSDMSLSKNHHFPSVPRGIPLSFMPGKGDLIAIDAEFVSLQKEEAEIRSDGHRSTTKPAIFACARISLVYGSGPQKNRVIVDDYIKMSEPVVDYLTKYSGINPGDLDPGVSTKHLTTLKNSYSKIRFLELCGCVFVGHGLSKDFRVINISPPSSQVIDTVNIYHVRGRRKISLKYLAYAVLGVRMQTSHLGHDSIEDARAALQLYEKHLELKNDPEPSAWNTFLQAIYENGTKTKFQVPP